VRVLAAVMLVLAFAAVAAHADGDPASDVLLRDNVFYPYNDGVSPGLQKTLDDETVAAGHAHFPIKVALIQSPMDLGAIPSMFGRPQTYADFLEQEIAAGSKRPLLVVMPMGYGIQGIGTSLSSWSSSVAESLARPSGTRSDDLARAAIAAVQVLAAKAGHRIDPAGSSSPVASGRQSLTLGVAALAFGGLAAAAALVLLRARGRWLSSDRVQPGGAYVTRTPRATSTAARLRAHARGRVVVQPLLVVAFVLIVAGGVWSVARGLNYYGLSPLEVGYDLDQPPLLLIFVGAWLWYRSARR
jgi:hypothetical protein